MNTNEIVAILTRIKDFYINDGHFIAENEAEKEIEALKHAIRCVEDNYELQLEIENLKQDIYELYRIDKNTDVATKNCEMHMIDKLELMRSWAIGQGWGDWVEQLNDVIDRIIILERDLRETKEQLEKIRILQKN